MVTEKNDVRAPEGWEGFEFQDLQKSAFCFLLINLSFIYTFFHSD